MVDVRVFGRLDPAEELRRLRDVPVNYELDGDPTPEQGWRFDSYVLVLPREAPGDPEPGGSFAIARRLVRDYDFADPTIIRSVFLPGGELQGRDMLLEGRFLFLRFLLGVRVSRVIDETTQVDGRPARVWGWCYRTLAGHLEEGEMCYRVVKMLDDGDVQFRVSRYLRTEPIANAVVRLGWSWFGRFMQVLFVTRSLTRMRRLVKAELALGRHEAASRESGRRIAVTREPGR